MKGRLLIAGSLVLFAAAAAHAQSRPTTPVAASGPPSYESFRLLRGRYIFDPDRRGMRGDSSAAVSSPRSGGGALPNYITLTGVMVTAGRKLAFFSGARPEYNRVLSPNGKVADFVVTDVAPGQVQLQLGGKPVVVAVGQNVPLTGSAAAGVPGLQPPPDVAPPPSSAGLTPSGPATSGPPPPAPVGLEEMQRRMMERRQKELGK